MNSETIKILRFLDEISIKFVITDEDYESFLPGVKIDHGDLIINIKNLVSPGDILHEAGHLACLPSRLRNSASGDLAQSVGPDYSYEMGAMLWSVAAANHLKIPYNLVFHDKGYGGDSEWLLKLYSSGNYLGLPLLQWMGIAFHDDEIECGQGYSFPALKKWLRD